ncbi:MAG: type I restriction enzyme HsdR N-terminal domain-containing protein [Bacteroidetes bacterium]|nr:type I restriction enzyme HsdR N-terminal domain-containing protein [Bacteroidota bacterium]
MSKNDLLEIVKKLSDEIFKTGKPKRFKVRTLLKYFSFEKRTEENSFRITELFSDFNILLNPSIMKIGDTWKLKLDDRVYLTPRVETAREEYEPKNNSEIYDWKSDKWFDEILTKEFRTEKEVENKFIIPLLNRLNYTENDRYDGMLLSAAHGSKQTVLQVDFALFNKENEFLGNQPLLIAEAKKEDRLYKQVELDKAQKQVKSYAVWLSCHFGLVTDSKTIQIIDLFPSINGMKVIFECKREDLKEKFGEIYDLISKENLTEYYQNLFG